MKQTDWSKKWRFWKQGSEEKSRWINLPHDAMLEEKRDGELSYGSASGYFPGGHYYYEKWFSGEEIAGRRVVQMVFDGVYGITKVYLNDDCVAENHYGYSDFVVDLTGRVDKGKKNQIRLDVDNTWQPNSRWYTGSGIYRHVRLLTGGRYYIPYRGIHVTTKAIEPPTFHMEVQIMDAEVGAKRNVEMPEIEQSGMDIRIEVWDGEHIVATAQGTKQDIRIPDGKLWSAEFPNLYQIHVILTQNGEMVDDAWTTSGFRQISWNTENGLQVNGKSIKLKGGCVHHDHGILGACSYYAAEYRRVRKLKDAGYNAIRTSHNPVSEECLAACDELGMYVLHESFDQWREPKSEYDYAMFFEQEWKQDLQAMIEKSFNHPSVIMYAIGNEVSIGSRTAHEINWEMTEFCHFIDVSRPVTNAVNCLNTLGKPVPKEKEKPIEKPFYSDLENQVWVEKKEKMTGSFLINTMMTALPFLIDKLVSAKSAAENLGDVMDALDITGLNYSNGIMEELHAIKPSALLLNTETFPARIGKQWPVIERNPYIIGDFMWTAWDYIGETGIGVPGYGKDKYRYSRKFPCINAGCGSFDLIGQMDAQGYYTAVVFGAYHKPYIGVRPMEHWNDKVSLGIWRGTDAIDSWSWDGYEGKTAKVVVFSVGEEVELYLNGTIVGRKRLQDFQTEFFVPYMPGELKAVSYNGVGEVMEENMLRTAGKDIHIDVQAEREKIRADGDDIFFVDICLVDSAGIPVVQKDCEVKVTVEGAGTLIGLGSAVSNETEGYLSGRHSTYRGRALAVIRSNGADGDIVVKVSSDRYALQEYIVKAVAY